MRHSTRGHARAAAGKRAVGLSHFAVERVGCRLGDNELECDGLKALVTATSGMPRLGTLQYAVTAWATVRSESCCRSTRGVWLRLTSCHSLHSNDFGRGGGALLAFMLSTNTNLKTLRYGRSGDEGCFFHFWVPFYVLRLPFQTFQQRAGRKRLFGTLADAAYVDSTCDTKAGSK